jgi:hypothetical protein
MEASHRLSIGGVDRGEYTERADGGARVFNQSVDNVGWPVVSSIQPIG